ncbi:MAG: LLM class F420-dependent oxidoreductase [SAR324 cluster bacterium]|nr:LLM class F420-dependent oxidoreductase [SAR324 cluster bacterium]MCZ6556618.1 LLM class F420-dependent oxidoreductase [SAR324 cluster bacterium]
MKVGIAMFVTGYTINMVTLARKAESLGFESLWVPEHPIIPVHMTTPFSGGGPLPEQYKHLLDPFTGLAAAAGATEKLILGTGICLVPERNALITAKEVATLDVVSGGRFEFGIGAGWLREESDIFAVDFPRRWTQTKEHILAMKALWSGEEVEFHGKYVDFPKLWCSPRPLQKPHPPILIAGELERSASRVVEYGDGWFPRARNLGPAELESGRKKIESLYREAGRDTAGFTVSLFGAPAEKDSNRAYADAGADRAIHILPPEEEDKILPMLEQMAAELL